MIFFWRSSRVDTIQTNLVDTAIQAQKMSKEVCIKLHKEATKDVRSQRCCRCEDMNKEELEEELVNQSKVLKQAVEQHRNTVLSAKRYCSPGSYWPC